MTTNKPRLVFADQAANRLRKIPTERRNTLVNALGIEIAKRPEANTNVASVPGTDYVAVHIRDNVAFARPLTAEERARLTPNDEEAYFIADVVPEDEVKRGRSRL